MYSGLSRLALRQSVHQISKINVASSSSTLLVRPTYVSCVNQVRSFAEANIGSGDSITYSGGQASSGQGGFYGAGGSRALGGLNVKHRSDAVAHVEDIAKMRSIMSEVYELETQLNSLTEKDIAVKIQIKGNIRKKMTSRDMFDLLGKLEMKGEPVWGLSQTERELVKEARRKVNSC